MWGFEEKLWFVPVATANNEIRMYSVEWCKMQSAYRSTIIGVVNAVQVALGRLSENSRWLDGEYSGRHRAIDQTIPSARGAGSTLERARAYTRARGIVTSMGLRICNGKQKGNLVRVYGASSRRTALVG